MFAAGLQIGKLHMLYRYEVAFVMPSKYTRESLPKPKDEDVKIEEVPGHTYGALSWRCAMTGHNRD